MKGNISAIIRGSLLIAGTTIGGGMLGIPLLTAKAGFFPALWITLVVWFVMMCSGLLFLEAILWMDPGANVLSMSKRFLGYRGRAVSGTVFLLLYYCLMIAYFAAGAPLFGTFVQMATGLQLENWLSYVLYGFIFGFIVYRGIKSVDRVNYLLMIALVITYLGLVIVSSSEIEATRLYEANWQKSLLAAPILFSAFGYHNIIPSLTTYFNRNGQIMRWSIFIGTIIPLLIYIIWQWLIIGVVPSDIIGTTLLEGKPVTNALEMLTHKPSISYISRVFGFLAIVTSMMGVAFSMVDFIGDGLKMARVGRPRMFLCVLVFFPPFLLVALNPDLFLLALGFAGGFGEAFLNVLLPVALVWVGRYARSLKSEYSLPGRKWSLFLLFLFGLLVICLEIIYVFIR